MNEVQSTERRVVKVVAWSKAVLRDTGSWFWSHRAKTLVFPAKLVVVGLTIFVATAAGASAAILAEAEAKSK